MTRSTMFMGRRGGLLSIVVVAIAWLVFGGVAVGAADELPGGSAAQAASGRAASGDGRISFVGHNIFGSAHGVFHTWRIVEQSVDLADPAASQAVVEVTVASVDTKTKSRDEHLRTADFFHVEKFPVATVRGHSPRALEPGPSGRLRYGVKFDVDLHGVKKTVDGEVEIVETNPVVVEGGFTIMRSEFGVGEAPSSWNPMSIDDAVPVRFRIRF